MGVKKLAIWVDSPYKKDALFDISSPLNRDNCLANFRLLESDFLKRGCECHTQDIYISKNVSPDIVLFLDIPKTPVRSLLGEWESKVKKFVVLQEGEMIKPQNWIIKNHEQFDTIFTWNDSLVDNKKYFKLNFCNSFPSNISKNFFKKEKLCVIIAGHRKSSHSLELYSKREEAIRWFEKNHPEDFDLYGREWNEFVFHGIKIIRAFNRIKPLKRLFAHTFPSYRGPVKKKHNVLEKYKFSVCYENNSGMPGYISEKIFDCFIAGCLPVYWGAPNIKDHIPTECFLDKREFSSYDTLYKRMKTMSDSEYLSRLDAIEAFLKSEKGYKFSVECFVETIVKVLLG